MTRAQGMATRIQGKQLAAEELSSGGKPGSGHGL